MSISFEDFGKLEFKVGRIVEVEDIPQARKPMYRVKIDFGDAGIRQCVGGIKEFYTRDQLLGREVVAILNLKPKPIAGVLSECMMLAAFDEKNVSLLKPDKDMPVGTKVA